MSECPRCGAALPPDAPRGECPRCLLQEALNPASATVDVAQDLTTDHGASVLETVTAAPGPLPGVLPGNGSLDERVSPHSPPSSPERPLPSDHCGRYELFGEIARGGMGAVLRGRDPELGRELAIKVLLEGQQDQPAMVRRFLEEAQIGGQLQHPGIVPVYEMGTFRDARPYFTMKLVQGRTLSALLGERKAPAHDRPRFLSIFEAIAQTVAYAHARGVIHRDLKPSNVMVGSFGEVQVMDWGLAKVLDRGGCDDQERRDPAPIRPTSCGSCGAAAMMTYHGREASWAHRPTCLPSRPRATISSSTSGPTFSAWGRSSARSSVERRLMPGAPGPR